MQENVKVFIRFRPINRKEANTDSLTVHNNSIKVSSHVFTFDKVFFESDQETVYTSVKKAVESVCQGYNATIFAYGNTSSGKTFTMFGTKENPGIIPRACSDIFERSPETVDYSVKCSFLEIYQEKLFDLLDPKKEQESLKIRQTEKTVYVQGLYEKPVFSETDILDAIKEGAEQRSVACTNSNNVSSRSHAVLTLSVTQTFTDGSECTSKLHMIDLAGSENVEKSGVQGTMLSEAKMINKSLCSLGNVISALTETGREHIPYRDSKLTYLLQDSLGGNSKTIVIATASQSEASFSETINTLKFASRMKEIKNIPTVNKKDSNSSLLRTIETLKKKIAVLEKREGVNIYQELEEEYERSRKLGELLAQERAICRKIAEKLREVQDKNLELENKLVDKI
jgi:kinesin family protein 5